jgi:hypothetical protein
MLGMDEKPRQAAVVDRRCDHATAPLYADALLAVICGIPVASAAPCPR